jgi:hypothetical protein
MLELLWYLFAAQVNKLGRKCFYLSSNERINHLSSMCIIRPMLALLGPLDLYPSYYQKGFKEEQSKSRLELAVLMGVTPTIIRIISFLEYFTSIFKYVARISITCVRDSRDIILFIDFLSIFVILSSGTLSFKWVSTRWVLLIIHKICISLLGRKASLFFDPLKLRWEVILVHGTW